MGGGGGPGEHIGIIAHAWGCCWDPLPLYSLHARDGDQQNGPGVHLPETSLLEVFFYIRV